MVGRPHKSILVLASNPATPSSREPETSPNSPPETTRFHPENHIDLVPMALKDVPEGQLHIPTFCQSTPTYPLKRSLQPWLASPEEL
ncbi:unnamed protein product, partial [Sphagnum jensenii]